MERVKPPDTVFDVTLVAAVCPNRTLPIPGIAAGAVEISDPAIAQSPSTRQSVLAFGVGSRTLVPSSPYRASSALWALSGTHFAARRP
jgi:hypothetical protein